MYKNVTVISRKNGFNAARRAAMTSWHRPVHSTVGQYRPTLILSVRHYEWVAWGRWLMRCGRDTHLADIWRLLVVIVFTQLFSATCVIYHMSRLCYEHDVYSASVCNVGGLWSHSAAIQCRWKSAHDRIGYPHAEADRDCNILWCRIGLCYISTATVRSTARTSRYLTLSNLLSFLFFTIHR